MKIRKATENDCEKIVELLYQTGNFHHHNRPDIFKSNLCKFDIEKVKEILNEQDHYLFVAVNVDDLVIGYVFIEIQEYKNHFGLKDNKSLYILDICVDEKFRNLGTGSLLLNHCKQIAIEHECQFIDLNVWSFNHDAIKFYEKHGFTERSIKMECSVRSEK